MRVRKVVLASAVLSVIFLIIAVLMIPVYAKARMANNEKETETALRWMGSIQVTYKTSDFRQKMINDYWTADVAGLYYLIPSGSTTPIRMIEPSVALADGNTDMTDVQTTYAPPTPPHESKPRFGYWFQMQSKYENEFLKPVSYGRTHVDRFSIVACPDEYGVTGKTVFVYGEAGTLYRWDLGSDAAIWISKPRKGIQDPGGVLHPKCDIFPASPGAVPAKPIRD